MTLYDRIRKRREELGLSQDDLAKKMGYKSRSSINKIEMGLNDIPQSKIIQFARALETTPAYLMGWDDEKQQAIEDMFNEEPDEKMLDMLRGRADRGKSDDIMIFGYGKGVIHIPKEKQEKLKKLLEAADLVDESDFLP